MSKKVKKTTTTTVVEEIIETNNKTQIVCVLDRSGSMQSIIDDAIGGFNSFLKEQKKLDVPATMSVAIFDEEYDLIYDNVDLNDVKELTTNEWSPRGRTALNDAIGKTINSVNASNNKLSKDERPNKVLVCIVTDGYENASKEYTSLEIKNLTEKMKKNDWQFIYLGANQDAFAEGATRGFSIGNTLNYANTSTGNAVMFNTLSDATKLYRTVTTDSAQYVSMSANLVDSVTDGVTVTDGTATLTTEKTEE